MSDEAKLLREYVETASETAFTTLVERHCGLVYQAALRQLGGNAPLAEDVTQSVFILLTQKARSLVRHPNLAGWLFATTHFVSIRTARAERRRRLREIAAQNSADTDLPAPSDWVQVRPALDAAILSLNRPDRQAIILRYFQGRAVGDVAKSLQITEGAAYKRLERAIERLRAVLAKRGITSAASALSLLIAEQARADAPAGMASAVAGKVLSAAATGPSAAGLLQLMGTAKTTAGLLGVAAILCLPGLGFALHESQAARRDEAALATASRAYTAAQAELSLLKRNAAQADIRRVQLQKRIDALGRSVGDPKADGQKFLASFPKARELLRHMLKSGYSGNYGPFYRSAGLSPTQIEQLENQAADIWIRNVELRPGNIGGVSNMTNIPDNQLRQILGSQAFQQFQDYNRALSAHGLANQVAAEVAYSKSPLSADQTDQLAAIVIANSQAYQGGREVDLASLDWENVQRQAKAVVPEPLWAAAQSAILANQYGIEFNKALTQASRESAAAAKASR